jgi:pyruvate dehydrogenase E1 component alpha subunit
VLEARTYRYRGHSVADAGLAYRTKDEIAEHQERDPLLRVASRLREMGVGTDDLREIDERVEQRVQAAVDFANDSPDPDTSQLAWAMYAQGSDEQFARMRPGSPFGEEELVFDAGLGK